MKHALLAFTVLLLISSCKEKKPTPALTGSDDATISSITLGEENFSVAVPPAGSTTTIANAPYNIIANTTALKVKITAAANATIRIRGDAFTFTGVATFYSHPVTFMVTAQNGTTVKSYSVAIIPYDEETNPCGIYTAKHLQDIDSAGGVFAKFILKNDINLPNADADGAKATGIDDYATAGWRPISSFFGTLDGGNFSINNLYINRTGLKVGLFAHLERGIIKNLGVNGVRGTAPAVMGKASGIKDNHGFTDIRIGILVGENGVETGGGTIHNCYATGNVSSSGSYASSVGGLVGLNAGSISNSYFMGSVSATATASSASAGGLVGHCEFLGKISNSYAEGSVSATAAFSRAGGLIGANFGSISNSYATGSVSAISSFPVADSDYYAYAGGLAGTCQFEGKISNSYATGNVSAFSNLVALASAGGLVGNNQRSSADVYTNCYRNREAVIQMKGQVAVPLDEGISGITAKTKAEMQTNEFKTSLNEKASVWGREDSKNDKLPYIIGVGVGKP